MSEMGRKAVIGDHVQMLAGVPAKFAREIQSEPLGTYGKVTDAVCSRSLPPCTADSNYFVSSCPQGMHCRLSVVRFFWDNRLFELREIIVHQGYHFMLPPLGEASGVV
jgi:hypothetical protein